MDRLQLLTNQSLLCYEKPHAEPATGFEILIPSSSPLAPHGTDFSLNKTMKRNFSGTCYRKSQID